MYAAFLPYVVFCFFKTVTYFGKGFAPTIWENIDFEKINKDMIEIKNDGFNSVLLVVPWNGMQLNLMPSYDEWISLTL